MEAKEEKVFYQDSQVQVTQSRFVARSRTFAMRNISSVSIFKKEKSRFLEIVMIIAGLICLFNTSSLVFGLLLIVAAVLLLFLLKNEYTVRISSNSGESDGFISTDKELVEKIVDAVNEAIIFRG